MNFIKNKDIIRGGQLTLLKIEAYDNVYVFYIQEPGAEVEKYSFNILNYADRKNKDYNLMFIEKALKHIIKTYEEGQARYILEDTTRRFEIAFEITNIRGSENKLLQMDIDISKLGSTRVKTYQPEIELVKERRQGTGQGDMAMRLDMDKMFNSYEFRAMMNDYRIKFYKQIYFNNLDKTQDKISFEDYYMINIFYDHYIPNLEWTDVRNYVYNYNNVAGYDINFVIKKKLEPGNQRGREIFLTDNTIGIDFIYENITRHPIFNAIIHILTNAKIISFQSFLSYQKVDKSNGYKSLHYIKITDEKYKPKHKVLEFTNLDDLREKITNISINDVFIDDNRTILNIQKQCIITLDYFVYNKKLYKSIIILNSANIIKIRKDPKYSRWQNVENSSPNDTTIYILCEEI